MPEKNKRIAKRIVKAADSTVNFAILLLLVLLLLLGSYAMWDSHQIYLEATASQYDIYKPDDQEGTLSFAELKALNPEVFGWLTVNGTEIDYPLVQGRDNEKYVNTNAKGEYSMAGAMFLDCRNSKDFTDFNSFIYGHHMGQHAMFGDLDKFEDADYFESHQYGNLYYQGKDHGLEFFAFLKADAYNGQLYRMIKDAENQQEYLDYINREALHLRDINISIDDRIVLLSTCSSASTNGRYLLAGRITDQLYPDSGNEDSSVSTREELSASGKLMSLLEHIPIWARCLIITIIILILLMLCMLRRRCRRNDREL